VPAGVESEEKEKGVGGRSARCSADIPMPKDNPKTRQNKKPKSAPFGKKTGEGLSNEITLKYCSDSRERVKRGAQDNPSSREAGRARGGLRHTRRVFGSGNKKRWGRS